MSLRRKIFYGFTLAVVAVLLILPSTGWLARLQLLPFTLPGASRLLSPQDEVSQNIYEKHAADVVARSGDFDLKFAHSFGASTSGGRTDETLRRQEKLDEAFPQNPAVIAAILKTMTREAVKVQREEEKLLSAPPNGARRSRRHRASKVIRPIWPCLSRTQNKAKRWNRRTRTSLC